MSIVVAGATGQLGRLVVRSLIAKGVDPDDIVAIGRNEEQLADLSGSGLCTWRVDYSDGGTLGEALAGADRVLLISGNEMGQRLEQHKNVIDAAKDADVQLIAYTSIPHADSNDMMLAEEHRATEEAIDDSGLPHTFLRNSWYIENYSGQLATYTERGTVMGAAGDGRVSLASRADYAEAAAAVLLMEQPHEVYELGGAPVTLQDIADEASRVTGTDIAYTDLSVYDLTQALAGAGVPEHFAAVMADADLGIRRGDLFVDTADLEGLLGRPATSLADGLRAAL